MEVSIGVPNESPDYFQPDESGAGRYDTGSQAMLGVGFARFNLNMADKV